MKRALTIIIAILVMLIVTVFLTKQTATQTKKLNQSKQTISHNQIKTSNSTVKKDEISSEQDNLTTETPSVTEKEDLITALTTLDNRIDSSFAEWLVINYSDASKIVSGETNTDSTYLSSLWYTLTQKTLFVLKDEFEGTLKSPEKMQQKQLYTKACANDNYVLLRFAGDISYSDDYAPSLNYTKGGIDAAFSKDLQTTMRTADLFMVNNEFCYSNRGTAQAGKTYTFRGNPDYVKRLDEIGADIVSIANNHVFDYGEEAFLDTLDTLNNDHMPYVGGGTNLEDAMNHIVYYIANGIKIGYIAATAIEQDGIYTKEATETSPGVVRCQSPERVNTMIQAAKQNCDFVIVYPHWGIEYSEQFNAAQQTLAHSFIDAGADAVIGGHTHCLQGIEEYNNKPIFYSVSNFNFSGKVIQSMVVELKLGLINDITTRHPSIGVQSQKIYPCMENSGKTSQCDKGDANYTAILDLLNRVSVNVKLDNNGDLSIIQ